MNVSHSRRISLALLFTAALCALTQVGCGGTTVAKATPTPTPTTAAGQQFLYLTNGSTGTSAYQMNSAGSLSLVAGSPFLVGGTGLATDRAGKFVYTTSSTGLTTSSAASTGALTSASVVTDATFTGSISLNPAGTALYASSIDASPALPFNNGWKNFSVPANGALKLVSGQIEQVAGLLAFTADGQHAYNATCFHASANIEHFTVAATGVLTDTTQAVTLPPNPNNLECPLELAINPAGDTLASTWVNGNGVGPADNVIVLYTINASTHALTMAASPFPISGQGQSLTYDPSGKFIVVAQDSGVGVYKAGANTLSEASGSPFATGTNFLRLMFSPSGAFVVAISQKSQQVSVFAFNSTTGALTTVPGSPFSATISFGNMAMIQR
jgi:6-phosphogluconolactonase (cycloisomerase 2 family)